jgi:hypothetical protein
MAGALGSALVSTEGWRIGLLLLLFVIISVALEASLALSEAFLRRR